MSKNQILPSFILDKVSDASPVGKYLQSTSTWFHKSYLLDWILSLALFVAAQAVNMFVDPFDRYLPPNDPSVAYPHRADMVPNAVLMILAIVLPIGIFALAQIWKRSGHDFHHAMLGLVIAVFMTNVVTSALKTAAGRYRPDFVSSFQGQPFENEGRFSFPSGHASNAFAGMTFLTLYLMGKYHIWNDKATSSFGRAILTVSPMSIAFFIAISRTIDYHHNFSDIIGGALIGSGFAFFSYFLYFPSLFQTDCHNPKMHPKLMVDLIIAASTVQVVVESTPAASLLNESKVEVD